jgi:prepilin-type N-terminal cleavage/methylation domain-containing protein
MIRRGFTLLETVAVLVLVSVIALVAIPTFRVVLDSRTTSALELSAEAVITELRSEQRLSGNSLTLAQVDEVVYRIAVDPAGRLVGGFLPRFGAGQIRLIYTDARETEDLFRSGKLAVCVYVPAEALDGTLWPNNRNNARTVEDALWSYEVVEISEEGSNPWGALQGPEALPCGA